MKPRPGFKGTTNKPKAYQVLYSISLSKLFAGAADQTFYSDRQSSIPEGQRHPFADDWLVASGVEVVTYKLSNLGERTVEAEGPALITRETASPNLHRAHDIVHSRRATYRGGEKVFADSLAATNGLLKARVREGRPNEEDAADGLFVPLLLNRALLDAEGSSNTLGAKREQKDVASMLTCDDFVADGRVSDEVWNLTTSWPHVCGNGDQVRHQSPVASNIATGAVVSPMMIATAPPSRVQRAKEAGVVFPSMLLSPCEECLSMFEELETVVTSLREKEAVVPTGLALEDDCQLVDQKRLDQWVTLLAYAQHGQSKLDLHTIGGDRFSFALSWPCCRDGAVITSSAHVWKVGSPEEMRAIRRVFPDTTYPHNVSETCARCYAGMLPVLAPPRPAVSRIAPHRAARVVPPPPALRHLAPPCTSTCVAPPSHPPTPPSLPHALPGPLQFSLPARVPRPCAP